MKISDVLTPARTCSHAPGISKKRVLEFISEFVAERDSGIRADELYQQLLARERLGSTGIGEGVAIPHCRLSGCAHIVGSLLKLDSPVDFDSIDKQPVDLVFVLVVPQEQNEEHLQILAAIAQLLQDPEKRRQLRSSATDESLYESAVTESDSAL